MSESDPAWSAFWSALQWQPIAEYDREAAPHAALRAGDQWTLGYWGDRESDGDPYPAGPMWRVMQDSMLGAPLTFEPDCFAIPSEEWAGHLFHD